MNKVKVWDLPTRLFHWGLVACFAGLVATGEVGDSAMVWHFRLGYGVLTLLLFRVVWGFIGGHWSRFSTFVAGPRTVLRYLKGERRSVQSVGHNPLGSLSVLALLGFVLLQAAAGLFSDDDIATAGPLAKLAPGAWVSFATHYHTTVGKITLVALVVLHLAAIAFYRFRYQDNLARSMFTGDKELPVPFESARDDAQSRGIALAVLGVCAGLVAGLLQWAN